MSTKEKAYSKRRKSKIKKGRVNTAFDFFNYGIAILFIIIIIYPLWFVFIASFSDPNAVANGSVYFWPSEVTLKGYTELFKQVAFWRSSLNSILYTVVGTFIAVMVNLAAGFVLTRKNVVGIKFFQILYFIPLFFGGGLIPTYMTIRNYNMLNTFWVMVIPFAVSAYNILIIRNFFNTNESKELWDSSRIDGAGTLRYYFTILIPLSKPIISIITLWTAVGLWNDWFNGLIYLDVERQPLQLLLRRILITGESLVGESVGELGIELRKTANMMKYSSIVVSTLPIMFLYPALQKHFDQGIMTGAIKG